MIAFLNPFKALFASRSDAALRREVAELSAVVRRQSEALHGLAEQLRVAQDDAADSTDRAVRILRREQAEAVAALNKFWADESLKQGQAFDAALLRAYHLHQGLVKQIDELDTEIRTLQSDLASVENSVGDIAAGYDEVDLADYGDRLDALEAAVEQITDSLESSVAAQDELIALRLVTALRQAADKIENI